MANNFGNDIFNKIENEGLATQFLLDSSSVKLRHIVKFKTENLNWEHDKNIMFRDAHSTIKLIEEQMSRDYKVLL